MLVDKYDILREGKEEIKAEEMTGHASQLLRDLKEKQEKKKRKEQLKIKLKEYKESLKLDMTVMKRHFRDLQKNKGGINVVMIAEKPSVARAIANALAPKIEGRQNIFKDRWKGFSSYEFYGRFHGVNAYFYVLSLFGHLYK
jgi:hypothetical protein